MSSLAKVAPREVYGRYQGSKWSSVAQSGWPMMDAADEKRGGKDSRRITTQPTKQQNTRRPQDFSGEVSDAAQAKPLESGFCEW